MPTAEYRFNVDVPSQVRMGDLLIVRDTVDGEIVPIMMVSTGSNRIWLIGLNDGHIITGEDYDPLLAPTLGEIANDLAGDWEIIRHIPSDRAKFIIEDVEDVTDDLQLREQTKRAIDRINLANGLVRGMGK